MKNLNYTKTKFGALTGSSNKSFTGQYIGQIRELSKSYNKLEIAYILSHVAKKKGIVSKIKYSEDSGQVRFTVKLDLAYIDKKVAKVKLESGSRVDDIKFDISDDIYSKFDIVTKTKTKTNITKDELLRELRNEKTTAAGTKKEYTVSKIKEYEDVILGYVKTFPKNFKHAPFLDLVKIIIMDGAANDTNILSAIPMEIVREAIDPDMKIFPKKPHGILAS